MINNRKVLQHHLGADPPLSVIFAVPDHPWVDAADGAAVRISMTVDEGATTKAFSAGPVRRNRQR